VNIIIYDIKGSVIVGTQDYRLVNGSGNISLNGVNPSP